MLKINIKKTILLIYFCLILCQELIPHASVVCQLINICYGFVLLLLFMSKKIAFKNLNGKNVVNFTLVVTIIGLLLGSVSYVFNNNNGFFFLFKLLTHLEIAFIIFDNSTSYKFYNKIYYLSIILIIIKWIIVKNENVVFNSSRNTISTFLLFLWCIDLFYTFKNNLSIDYKKMIITLILSLLAKGRSGILISIFCSFLIITYNLLFKKDISKFKTIIVITSLLIAIFFSLDLVNKYLESFDRWGMETIRTEFWINYINNVFESSENILLGSKLTDVRTLELYNYNLHNSFLMLHANYGLIPLLFVVYEILRCIIFSLKNRKFYIFLFSIILLTKGNIDYIIFHSYFDILFYLILFELKLNKGE